MGETPCGLPLGGPPAPRLPQGERPLPSSAVLGFLTRVSLGDCAPRPAAEEPPASTLRASPPWWLRGHCARPECRCATTLCFPVFHCVSWACVFPSPPCFLWEGRPLSWGPPALLPTGPHTDGGRKVERRPELELMRRLLTCCRLETKCPGRSRGLGVGVGGEDKRVLGENG